MALRNFPSTAIWWGISSSRATHSASARVMRSKGARRWSSMALLLVVSMSARAAGDLKVEDAWIRWLPANLPGAGYMTLTNMGMTERVLLGASSPDYGDISFHR